MNPLINSKFRIPDCWLILSDELPRYWLDPAYPTVSVRTKWNVLVPEPYDAHVVCYMS